MKPSSFCTICTKQCKDELIGFLLSLSIHHQNEKVYIMCDTGTKTAVNNLTPQPKLNITWFIDLDKYSTYNRSQMSKLGIWSDFQMSKALVMKKALEENEDTLFLDSDIIILDTIDNIDNSKDLGVSPQFIKKKNVDETGYYNGGTLWAKNKNIPDDWIEFTKTSRYFDQASIEDLTTKYEYFEFGENYNLQTWRFILGLEPTNVIASYVNVKSGKIYYKKKPLKYIHTHFNQPNFKQINEFFIAKMKEAKLYKELMIIYRLIRGKWIIKIPKQPMSGLWRHKNDSFRQLALLLKKNSKDVDIELIEQSGHCWLEPNILLYDRPTLEWCDNEITNSSLFLLGNGSMKTEGQILEAKGIVVKPWIFWARKPFMIEKLLNKMDILTWEERENDSIFIGNFENKVQEKYRKTNHNWENVLTECHVTAGMKHLFTNEEYLMKLRNSKYGLCLRGYGSKCHREVELMAFGTVPIVTPNVSILSYMDPPVENIHFIKVNNPEELKEKITKITKEKWEEMSKACYEWYQRNIYSKNCWNTMMNNILY